MDNALPATGAIAVRPQQSWIARRCGAALEARRRRVEYRRSREYLIELYERRCEAARLHDERYGYDTFARII